MPGKLGIIYMATMPGGTMSGKLPLTSVEGTNLPESKPWCLFAAVYYFTFLQPEYICSFAIHSPPCSCSRKDSPKTTHILKIQPGYCQSSDIIWIPPLLLGCLTILLPSLDSFHHQHLLLPSCINITLMRGY